MSAAAHPLRPGRRQGLRSGAALHRPLAGARRGRPRRRGRAERLRQVDAAPHPRRRRDARHRHARAPPPGARRLRAAGADLSAGRDRPSRSSRPRSPRTCTIRARRRCASRRRISRAGFDDRGGRRRDAVGRMAEAPRDRPRARPRARRAAARRADQPPRRRRHRLARDAAARRAPRLSRRQPRPLVPRERRRAHGRDRSASTPSGLFETRGRYSDFLERRDDALREQARVSARRSPIACAARSPGCARAPRRAPPSSRRASPRRAS